LAHSRDIAVIVYKERHIGNRDQQRSDMVHDTAHPCDDICCGQWRSTSIRPVPLIVKARDASILRDPVPCAHQRRGPLIKKTSPTCGAEIDGSDILEKEAERGVNDILESGRSVSSVSQENLREA
jgi:hypothetical protein